MENISPRQPGNIRPPLAVPQPGIKRPERPIARAAEPEAPLKRVGYGLPCANCRTYYAADLTACPICMCPQRVSATTVPARKSQLLEESIPAATSLEEERERFLKEFKSQIYAAHTQINAAATFRCTLEENHQKNGYEPAAVCQPCYTRVQEQVDQMEAALHMDLTEAAQIVYDAVWSDTSDSNKTYVNAAHALLAELRKRAGISLVLSPLKPLAH